MRDEWREVTLGQVARRRTDFTPVDRGARYTILGVQRSGWGFVKREPILGSEMKFSRLMQLGLDDLVYRTITAFEAPSSVAGPEEVGHFVTPQTFPVYQLDQSQLLPAYMKLLTTYPAFHEEMASRSTGTVLRRKTLSQSAFESIPLALPPLVEQRRIVDLVGALDDAITAAERSALNARTLLDRISRPDESDASVELGSLVTMRSGPSWSAADESYEPIPGATPVLGITNTPAGDRIRLDKRTYVRGLAPSVQRLTSDSIVMIRTNGNRARIGNVYRSTPEVEGFAVSAFQIAIQPHDARASAWLYWYLRSPEVQRSISESASGSTGLGNVAVRWLKEMRVPSFLPDDRDAYVERCEAGGAVVNALADETERLRTVRAELLNTLLSGDHQIPKSYDELLEAV